MSQHVITTTTEDTFVTYASPSQVGLAQQRDREIISVKVSAYVPQVRQPGAAALMMAHVACGLMDAFMEDDISYWDIAAGTALIRAAGGWAELAPSPTHPWARRIRAASSSEVWAAMDGYTLRG